MTTTVLAAGGIVLREVGGNAEVMLVHRPRYDDWSFPKGKPTQGEALRETALREVFEETALRCALGPFCGELTYTDELATPKLTRYWVMTVVGEEQFLANEEISARRWVEIPEAMNLLQRECDRKLLRAVVAVNGTER